MSANRDITNDQCILLHRMMLDVEIAVKLLLNQLPQEQNDLEHIYPNKPIRLGLDHCIENKPAAEYITMNFFDKFDRGDLTLAQIYNEYSGRLTTKSYIKYFGYAISQLLNEMELYKHFARRVSELYKCCRNNEDLALKKTFMSLPRNKYIVLRSFCSLLNELYLTDKYSIQYLQEVLVDKIFIDRNDENYTRNSKDIERREIVAELIIKKPYLFFVYSVQKELSFYYDNRNMIELESKKKIKDKLRRLLLKLRQKILPRKYKSGSLYNLNCDLSHKFINEIPSFEQSFDSHNYIYNGILLNNIMKCFGYLNRLHINKYFLDNIGYFKNSWLFAISKHNVSKFRRLIVQSHFEPSQVGTDVIVDGLRDMLNNDFQFNEINTMILIELVSISNFWLLSYELKDYFTDQFKYLVFEAIIYGLHQLTFYSPQLTSNFYANEVLKPLFTPSQNSSQITCFYSINEALKIIIEFPELIFEYFISKNDKNRQLITPTASICSSRVMTPQAFYDNKYIDDDNGYEFDQTTKNRNSIKYDNDQVLFYDSRIKHKSTLQSENEPLDEFASHNISILPTPDLDFTDDENNSDEEYTAEEFDRFAETDSSNEKPIRNNTPELPKTKSYSKYRSSRREDFENENKKKYNRSESLRRIRSSLKDIKIAGKEIKKEVGYISKETAKDVGHGVKTGAKYVGKGIGVGVLVVGGPVIAAGAGIGYGAYKAGQGAVHVGKKIGTGVATVGSGISISVISVGKGINKGFSAAGEEIKKEFVERSASRNLKKNRSLREYN